MLTIPDEYPSYYEFSGRKIEPRLCDITTTGAKVMVNSIGSQASFRNSIAKAMGTFCMSSTPEAM